MLGHRETSLAIRLKDFSYSSSSDLGLSTQWHVPPKSQWAPSLELLLLEPSWPQEAIKSLLNHGSLGFVWKEPFRSFFPPGPP